MPLFELESGHLVPAQFGRTVEDGLSDDVLESVRAQVLEIIARPLFPITWRDLSRSQVPSSTPRLTALDATGQVVAVEVLQHLTSHSLIAALSALADTAALSWTDLAREYPGGIPGFRNDWVAFRDSMPPAPGAGPRLIMVVGSIDPSARAALEVLVASGVEVHEANVRRMANGRTFLSVQPVGPRVYAHTPQIVGQATEVVAIESADATRVPSADAPSAAPDADSQTEEAHAVGARAEGKAPLETQPQDTDAHEVTPQRADPFSHRHSAPIYPRVGGAKRDAEGAAPTGITPEIPATDQPTSRASLVDAAPAAVSEVAPADAEATPLAEPTPLVGEVASSAEIPTEPTANPTAEPVAVRAAESASGRESSGRGLAGMVFPSRRRRSERTTGDDEARTQEQRAFTPRTTPPTSAVPHIELPESLFPTRRRRAQAATEDGSPLFPARSQPRRSSSESAASTVAPERGSGRAEHEAHLPSRRAARTGGSTPTRVPRLGRNQAGLQAIALFAGGDVTVHNTVAGCEHVPMLLTAQGTLRVWHREFTDPAEAMAYAGARGQDGWEHLVLSEPDGQSLAQVLDALNTELAEENPTALS